jgi:hypothetical protein
MRKRIKRHGDSAQQSNYKIGQSVVVKPGAKDIDYGYDLSGWQGRVIENHYVDEQKRPDTSPNYQPVQDYAVWFANR